MIRWYQCIIHHASYLMIIIIIREHDNDVMRWKLLFTFMWITKFQAFHSRFALYFRSQTWSHFHDVNRVSTHFPATAQFVRIKYPADKAIIPGTFHSPFLLTLFLANCKNDKRKKVDDIENHFGLTSSSNESKINKFSFSWKATIWDLR